MLAANAKNIFLLVAHFVCPLIFFTNFTRNPYQTQITLIHLCLVAVALCLLWHWALEKPGAADHSIDFASLLPLAPLAVFTVFCWITWLHSWLTHPVFFRPSIAAEGLRVNLFWIVNIILAALAGLWIGTELRRQPRRSPLWELDMPALAGIVLFGAGWLFFHRLRIPQPPSAAPEFWKYLWDPYGFFLWSAGLGFLVYRYRQVGPRLFFSINIAVGILASIYGVGQYFGTDLIWPRTMSPYGSRAISTFGNPNFLSPYLAILIPGLLPGLWSRRLWQRGVHVLIILLFVAGLLATQTRSSWAAAVAGCVVTLWLLRRHSGAAGLTGAGAIVKTAVPVAAAALVLFLVWSGGAQRGNPTALGRLLEVKQALFRDASGRRGNYQPVFQRFLIWTGCWRFVDERPLLGKGWGTLELFYPFYQGDLLYEPHFVNMRTHANNGHNEIIEVWSQTGIVGMGLFVWFFAVFFIWAIRNLECLADPDRVFAAGVIGGAAGMLVDNILNVSLHFSMPGYLFWWLVGLAAGLYPQPHQAPAAAPIKKGWRWATAGLAGAVLIVAGVHIVRYWLSDFYFFRGFVLHREGKLAAALERLETSYRHFPREVNKSYELGNIYARLGDPSKALWAYGEALKANAGYDEIFFNRGTMLARQDQDQEALKDLLTSIYVNPLHRNGYQHLVNAIFLKDPKTYAPLAIRVLEAAIHFFPQDKDFMNNLASFYSQDGRHLRAAEIFIEILKVDPSFELARRNLAGLILAAKHEKDPRRAKQIWQLWQSNLGGAPPFENLQLPR